MRTRIAAGIGSLLALVVLLAAVVEKRTEVNGGHLRRIVLDDFGLQVLAPQAAQDLYDLISERYERGSVIVTSNRALEEWPAVFGNDLLASATLDRLTHHAHTLILRGQSYRQTSRRKEMTSPTSA